MFCDTKYDFMPKSGKYAVGNIFLPQKSDERKKCKKVIEKVIAKEKQHFLGWRKVPTDSKKANVGPAAKECQPVMEQLFIGCSKNIDQDAFERKLYLIRKIFSDQLRYKENLSQGLMLYACSLSSRLIVYKGMLTPSQLFPFFPDLENSAFETHLAMVHSRFSTNTFPSWDRAQPCRYMCHNGEINTLKGNVNLMRARQGKAASELFGKKIKKLFPIESWNKLHLQIIFYGREFCSARGCDGRVCEICTACYPNRKRSKKLK